MKYAVLTSFILPGLYGLFDEKGNIQLGREYYYMIKGLYYYYHSSIDRTYIVDLFHHLSILFSML